MLCLEKTSTFREKRIQNPAIVKLKQVVAKTKRGYKYLHCSIVQQDVYYVMSRSAVGTLTSIAFTFVVPVTLNNYCSIYFSVTVAF